MAKRNKIRYKVNTKEKKTITLTGQVYLEYADEEALEHPVRGDLMMYPYNEPLNTTHRGDYSTTGFAGYFKVNVFEGNVWCLVQVNDIFEHQEHHFSKMECPIDTYHLCADILRALAGRKLMRTYREHYTLDDAQDEAGQDKPGQNSDTN